MIRKMLTATLVVAAMLLSVLSLSGVTTAAEAQGSPTCPYNSAIIAGRCAPALAYPGPFTNMPTAPGGAYGFGSIHPVTGAVPGATGGDTDGGGTDGGGGLAHTGSESAVLGYVGAGLIAFGAVALGSRRKFFQGTLD